jgi:acetoacetate decarboxylase
LIKSQQEIERLQAICYRLQFLGTRNLTVFFETDPDVAAALLPPPLKPAPQPTGLAWVGDIGNSGSAGPFQAAAVFLRARYGKIVADYCVAMYKSDAGAVVLGRELLGEPARVARIVLEENGEFVWGSAERHDIRFLSVRGRLTKRGAPARLESASFHFKFLPRADGVGFESPPLLVHVQQDIQVESVLSGRGELVFRDSPHDPLADIPIRQAIRAVYSRGHVYQSARVLCQVDPDAFLPYAYSRFDSFDEIVDGTLLQAQASRRSRDGRGRWRAV